MDESANTTLRPTCSSWATTTAIVLGSYLDVPPSTICFTSSEFGKPRLSEAYGGQEVRFNLSHSGHIGVLAVAVGLEVGIDVEELRPVEKGIVRQCCSTEEQQILEQLNDIDWLMAFYRCWTRKEAILKAEGVGIGRLLGVTDVSRGLDAEEAVIDINRGGRGASKWHVLEIRPAPDAIGALVTNEVPASVSLFRFPLDAN